MASRRSTTRFASADSQKIARRFTEACSRPLTDLAIEPNLDAARAKTASLGSFMSRSLTDCQSRISEKIIQAFHDPCTSIEG
jgi:hypothetical protein